jgi:hypothetical protein
MPVTVIQAAAQAKGEEKEVVEQIPQDIPAHFLKSEAK